MMAKMLQMKQKNILTENGPKDDEMECASVVKNTMEPFRDEGDMEMEKIQVSIEVNHSSEETVGAFEKTI